MPRSPEQLLVLWKKATKEKPIKIAEDEWDNFRGALATELEEYQDKKNNFPNKRFYVNNDIKSYISPLSGELVTSRKQRREEMKKHGVREVDPSECQFKRRERDER